MECLRPSRDRTDGATGQAGHVLSVGRRVAGPAGARACGRNRGRAGSAAKPGESAVRINSRLDRHHIPPQVSLHQVLQVVRDYSRYKELYEPDVLESKTVQAGDMASGAATDRFSMLLIHKALSLKTAIDTDYESRITRLDDRRVYSIGHTTRIQEMADYGSSAEHLLPEGTGHGFIWRLCAINRYMERDGGVYIELEAIALSRDVPASIRWIVEPVVRRLSRNSLSASLQQTGKAVRRHAELAKRNDPVQESSALSYKP